MLRSRGIRTLVFTGIATNVCVESTLRGGFPLEYFGIVLADATPQAGPAEIQAASLYNIEAFSAGSQPLPISVAPSARRTSHPGARLRYHRAAPVQPGGRRILQPRLSSCSTTLIHQATPSGIISSLKSYFGVCTE